MRTEVKDRYHKQWHSCFVNFQVLYLQHSPRLITITLYDTKDIHSNIYRSLCDASCKVIAYKKASSMRFDVYKKKAAKAPTPATKPAALSDEAAPVNIAGVEGLV
jgi:hypothetical protein